MIDYGSIYDAIKAENAQLHDRIARLENHNTALKETALQQRDRIASLEAQLADARRRDARSAWPAPTDEAARELARAIYAEMHADPNGITLVMDEMGCPLPFEALEDDEHAQIIASVRAAIERAKEV